MQMTDGNGNAVEMVGMTNDQRLAYLMTYIKDDRARDELKHLADLVHNISANSSDEEISADAEEILFCMEAIFGYESGHFKGRDYWSEVYWENYKRWYSVNERRE